MAAGTREIARLTRLWRAADRRARARARALAEALRAAAQYTAEIRRLNREVEELKAALSVVMQQLHKPVHDQTESARFAIRELDQRVTNLQAQVLSAESRLWAIRHETVGAVTNYIN